MMDQKYLAEIKARAQEAKAEKRKGNDLDCACLSWAIVLNDIPALLAEVERLTDLSRQNYCKFVRQQEECAAKDQQIATLKKALKLACDETGESACPMTEGLDLENPVKACDEGCQGECGAECWKRYYIQQAQEQEGKK